MRAHRLLPLILVAVLAPLASAQDKTEPAVIRAAQGITITALGTVGADGDIPTTTLEELHVSRRSVSAEIPLDGSFATFSLAVASKANGQVTVEVDGEDLVMRSNARATLLAGEPRSFSFTAFAPGEGVIIFRNDAGDVLAAVPYSVTRKSPVRQRVSFNVNERLNLSGSYGVSYSRDGFGVNLSLRVDLPDGRFRGNLSGSYSW